MGLSDFVDSSGFRMYWTDEPQAIEIGAGGVALHPFGDGLAQWIPGGLSFVRNSAFMPSECTEWLPEEGVQVFATNLHAHTIGAALSLRHFRDGVELEPLDENMDYDFNYQQGTRCSGVEDGGRDGAMGERCPRTRVSDG